VSANLVEEGHGWGDRELAAIAADFVTAVKSERVRRQEIELSRRTSLLLTDRAGKTFSLRGDLIQRAEAIL
jgi:hypothetical protein